MSDYLVSIDAGNGGVNGLRAMKRNYKSIYFPSVRAATTINTLNLGDKFETDYDYVEWGGHIYVVGDDVSRTRTGNERHMGAFRYGDEFHQFLVAVALARLGIKKGSVDLTLFAPPGIFPEAREAIQKRFNEHGGNLAIRLKGDNKPRLITIEKINVFPEGAGALFCFGIDDSGNRVDTDALNGENVILDLGMFTLDALQITNGKINASDLQYATWETGGLKVHILDPLLRKIHELGDDFKVLTIDDVDRVIRKGLTEGNYTVQVAGLEADVKTQIDKFSERYAEWIANNIIDGVFSGLRGIKSMILVGGGAMLAKNHLEKWYKGKILDPSQYDSVKNIHPVDMNAVGGLRLAKMRLKQQQGN